MLGSRLAQGGVSFAGSALGSGVAVGDALALGLAGEEVALFDTLDAPFWLGLGSLVQPASHASLAHGWMLFSRPTRRRSTKTPATLLMRRAAQPPYWIDRSGSRVSGSA